MNDPSRMPRGHLPCEGGRAAYITFPAPAPAGECAIKGNINAKGERIYHVPGSRSYDVTKINPASGERWFCTEAEAVAAGWRAPKR